MTQTELNREVARATGESVARIARVGFRLEAPPKPKPYWRRPSRRLQVNAFTPPSDVPVARRGMPASTK